jgi:2-polyprenyl-3-methyl-5-hydroxy-6-metoxy-1,4-benzoquinol methylase
MVRGSQAVKNRVRQAEIFDAMWDPEITHNLFPDISFRANLYSTHWDMLFSRYLVNLEGKRVLDIGCGTGWTSLLLAQRGAKVTAVDISSRQIEILRYNAEQYGLSDRMDAVCGDITEMQWPGASFDICLGAAFLHHLELDEEEMILTEIGRLLAPGGTAYFVEPAVNSQLLNKMRYLVPVRGRPAIWSKNWKEYVRSDPHPHRDLSSNHFRQLGQQLFGQADVEALGIFNRLERLTRYRGKRLIHRVDHVVTGLLPRWLREPFSRAQVIRYQKIDAPQTGRSSCP